MLYFNSTNGYKVEFAEMLRIVPGNLQECYLFFCRNITYYSAQK